MTDAIDKGYGTLHEIEALRSKVFWCGASLTRLEKRIGASGARLVMQPSTPLGRLWPYGTESPMTERSHMLIDIATVLSLGPPKAKATGSNPVGCATLSQ